MTSKYRHLFIFICIICFPFLICGMEFDCKTFCSGDYTDLNYKPQECRDKCHNEEQKADGDLEEHLEEEQKADGDLEEHLEGIEGELKILKIMIIALLSLVVLLLILFMVNLTTNRKLKKVLLKFYSKLRNKDQDLNEREPTTLSRTESAMVSKINHTASHPSPDVSRGGGPQQMSSFRVGPRAQDLPSSMERRRRLPSESTCPDDSQETVTGYDNLAMSTSTVSFHSRPSSPLSPMETGISLDNTRMSIATLSTTVV